MEGVKWRFQTSEFHGIPHNLKERGVTLILRLCWSNFHLITTDWHDSIVNYEKYNSFQVGLF